MARAQFEYDEGGTTFFYVFISFYTMILIPLTYALWPSAPQENIVDESGCQCAGCKVKRDKKRAIKPWEYTKRLIKVVVLLVLWALYAYVTVHVFSLEVVTEEYDPYKILNVDQGAEPSVIKKAYRELTKTHHPDRGGDEKMFDNIAKAYQALTNDESRENWEKYGNPDGPKAATFGIALPKWIVSEQYGGFVLALYVGVFLVILPIIVGVWWTRSMKYSADKVLVETTRALYHFLQKTPSMNIQRALTVLSGACEYSHKFNTAIIERETDEFEVKKLIKDLRNINESKREAPFYLPWSIKARTLFHAYLTRLPMPSAALEEDLQYNLTRVMPIIEEFMRMHLQMYFHIPLQRPPTLEALENIMKLQPMFVQALWPQSSGLLQLPHITEFNIRFLRRNNVYTCLDLANKNEHKRRVLLNQIDEGQYEDVISVLTQMPRLKISADFEVQGEQDKDVVTVGSIVTLKVTIKRHPLLDVERRAREIKEDAKAALEKELEKEEEPTAAKSRKVWEKPQKKKPKTNKKKAPQPKKKAAPAAATPKPEEEQLLKQDDGSNSGESDEDGTNSESEGADVSVNNDDDTVNATSNNEDSGSDDDDGWDDGMVRKETLLDKEPTDNHPVHAPFFPMDKFEWYYVYLVEKKERRLSSFVVPCKTLKDEKVVELRFPAPQKPGVYAYTLHVRSDSYFDIDVATDVKLEVRPAPEFIPPKYIEDEADDDAQDDDDLSEYTEGSDSDESDSD